MEELLMYYNIDELKEAFSQGQRLKFLFFWGHQPRKDGTLGSSCLSQWYQAPFEVEKVKYKTAEHWMMAEKARLFDDMDNLKQILSTKSPALAKKIGRKVLRFDQEKWDSERFDIVVKGNYHKFTQNNGERFTF